MPVFDFLIMFLLGFAWSLIQVIFGFAMVFIVYFTIWFVLSMVWEIIHEPSYKWFVRTIKGLFRKLTKKLGVK